jgi:DNA-directed RNA polymerase
MLDTDNLPIELELAAARFRVIAAYGYGDTEGSRFVPNPFDGSCSGVQHRCAMTRAPEGSLVNLTPQPLPQDVYQVVQTA